FPAAVLLARGHRGFDCLGGLAAAGPPRSFASPSLAAAAVAPAWMSVRARCLFALRPRRQYFGEQLGGDGCGRNFPSDELLDVRQRHDVLIAAEADGVPRG